jgi:hypothetical protein
MLDKAAKAYLTNQGTSLNGKAHATSIPYGAFTFANFARDFALS